LDGCIVKTIDTDEKLRKLVQTHQQSSRTLRLQDPSGGCPQTAAVKTTTSGFGKLDSCKDSTSVEPLSESNWLERYNGRNQTENRFAFHARVWANGNTAVI